MDKRVAYDVALLIEPGEDLLAVQRDQVEEGWQQLVKGEVSPAETVFGELRSRLSLPLRGE
jgi:hypothetical protein